MGWVYIVRGTSERYADRGHGTKRSTWDVVAHLDQARAVEHADLAARAALVLLVSYNRAINRGERGEVIDWDGLRNEHDPRAPKDVFRGVMVSVTYEVHPVLLDATSHRDGLLKKMRTVDWSQVDDHRLESIVALLEGKAAPVARVMSDGTAAEACVVCGDLLEPRQLPRCEDCPDPEDVPEGEELHIDFTYR